MNTLSKSSRSLYCMSTSFQSRICMFNYVRMRFFLLLFVSLSSLHVIASADDVSKRGKSIVILHENDVHCNIDGYSVLSGLRNAVSDTAYVAITSSGDFLQGGVAGALERGRYIRDVMLKMNYDAVGLGNHEFDYDMFRLLELVEGPEIPVTCLNLVDCATQQPLFSRYIMRCYGTKRVAFVGVVTPTTLLTESSAFITKDNRQIYHLCEKSFFSDVQATVDAARLAGADYVVLLSHLGEDKNVMNIDSHNVIAATRGIDIVLDGHTHSEVRDTYVLNADSVKVPISQTGTKFRNIGKVVIQSDGTITTELIPCSSISFRDPVVKAVTDSVKAEMERVVNTKIGYSPFDLNILDDEKRQAVRFMETNAGDIVADAFRYVAQADIALTNGGGLRTSVKAGELTHGSVLDLLPYDNQLCTIPLKGSEIYDILNTCCAMSPAESGDFPQVSGLRFTLRQGGVKPCVSDVMVLDAETGDYLPLVQDAVYKVATINYCISGGGFASLLRGRTDYETLPFLYSDALVKYVTEALGGNIPERYAKPEGRITIMR